MSQDTILYDGRKAVNLTRYPDAAWVQLTPHVDEDAESGENLYKSVPWLFRGVDLRSQAVGSMPFSIIRGETEIDNSADYQNALGFWSNPDITLALVEAALTLVGRAYLFKLRAGRQVVALRYMVPDSIEPILSPAEGVTGFKRRVGGGTVKLDVDDVIYFWRPSPFVEIGPDDKSAAIAALAAAGVLLNTDAFVTAFFKRGAIKATLLTVSGSVGKEERERVERWWQKMVTGITQAWQTKVVNADAVTPVAVGEGVGELANTDLTKEKREDIATALGVPQTLLWSSEAGGLGGGGVVGQDDRHFYSKTVVPESKFIAGVLNDQLFSDLGYRLKFLPDTLDVYQEDETERAQAWFSYVSGGMPKGIAAEILGIELPAGVEYADLDEDEPEPEDEEPSEIGPAQVDAYAQPSDEGRQMAELQKAAMLGDLRKWRTKARKRGGACDFESEYIPVVVATRIMDRLAKATEQKEIDAAFSLAMPLTVEAEVKQHSPDLVYQVCPLCGHGEADRYDDHGGLCVCKGCSCTYDPAVTL